MRESAVLHLLKNVPMCANLQVLREDELLGVVSGTMELGSLVWRFEVYFVDGKIDCCIIYRTDQ